MHKLQSHLCDVNIETDDMVHHAEVVSNISVPGFMNYEYMLLLYLK